MKKVYLKHKFKKCIKSNSTNRKRKAMGHD